MENIDFVNLTREQKQEQAEHIAKLIIEGNFDATARENKPLINTIWRSSTASLFFLQYLNRYRAELISIPEQTFKSISTIMQGMLVFIQGSWMTDKPLYNSLKSKMEANKKSLSSKEKEQWVHLEGKNTQFIDIIELILILSQTFSTNENSEKKLIYETTDSCLFEDAVIWKRVMKRFISETLDRQIDLLKKQNIKITKELKEMKLLSIAQTTIITYQFNMSTFKVPQKVQEEAIEYILKEFKLNRASLGI